MVSKIRLSNFRNFTDKTFEFSEKITVIVGPNATGKTNLLESIFLLSTGKSFHAEKGEEMINYKENLARVKGKINKEVLEVILTRGMVNVGDEKIEKTPKKKLLLNGVAKRMIDFRGILKTVLFAPHDLDLVTESPSRRRNFLDTVLSQVDREYYRALNSYEKGLRQRNRLLYSIRENGGSRSQLTFWDQLLIKNGDYINNSRREFIEFVNNFDTKIPESNFKLIYDPSIISEIRIKEYEREEVAAATTLVGPHRDDFVFMINEERDLAKYGSRGEQRMGVLWLKLSELAFIFEKTSDAPTLLLDDIFSELDEKHREIVFEVAKTQQTIITTADPDFLVDMDELKRIEF